MTAAPREHPRQTVVTTGPMPPPSPQPAQHERPPTAPAPSPGEVLDEPGYGHGV